MLLPQLSAFPPGKCFSTTPVHSPEHPGQLETLGGGAPCVCACPAPLWWGTLPYGAGLLCHPRAGGGGEGQGWGGGGGGVGEDALGHVPASSGAQ